ncbi:MAG TPA: Gfo/Idh/MocA family oxidoreductase [Acidobacteriaceae bacterium]|nr:Gfo/Idh/MocA family oxidoreductase [Acidobacteriaceae bacterium]
MGKLGVGVVGVGGMGKRHAENLRRLVPRAHLVAVADADGARAAEVAAGLEIEHWCSSLEAMLERKDIAAVVISSPDKFHASAVKAAAEAGKHVLCEKPLGLDLQSAQGALQAVAKAGVHLQVGFMRRYDPAYAAAHQRIEAGEIGDPVAFKSIGRDKKMPPLTAYQSGVNGMLLFANTIHDFDLARWLMHDEVAEVHTFATTAIRPEIAQYGDVVASTVNLRFACGAIGNVESYVQAQYGYDVRTEIVGSKGSIFVGTLRQNSAAFLQPGRGCYELEDHFLSRFRDAYVAEVLDFVDTILNEREPRITGADGLRAVEIAAAAEKSYRTKNPCLVEGI